jgi:predicted nicotinamide N-methyase
VHMQDSPLTSDSTPDSLCLSHPSIPLLPPQYDVVQEKIDIGARTLTIHRVRDTNSLLRTITPDAFAVDERLPYWAELWPSSLVLAGYCLEQADLAGRRVLEVGCGLGVAGVAALWSGAHVLFTDYEADALAFARCNARANLPETDVDERAAFCLLDWRTADDTAGADLILGADVIYEKRNHLPILDLTRRVLTADGVALFTDPDRSTGMPFFALAERSGFAVSLSSRVQQYHGKQTTVLIGELRKQDRSQ